MPLLYSNKLKNREFLKSAPRSLTNPQDDREAGPCLKDRSDAAGLKSEDADDKKTNFSVCLGILTTTLAF